MEDEDTFVTVSGYQQEEEARSARPLLPSPALRSEATPLPFSVASQVEALRPAGDVVPSLTAPTAEHLSGFLLPDCKESNGIRRHSTKVGPIKKLSFDSRMF